MEDVRLVGVLVLIYIDDVLIVCGACSNFWDARSGFANLALVIAATCQGFGPTCCGDPPPPAAPIKLLRSMCVVCVLALPGWSIVSLPQELGRGSMFVYVDAALEGGPVLLGASSGRARV